MVDGFGGCRELIFDPLLDCKFFLLEPVFFLLKFGNFLYEHLIKYDGHFVLYKKTVFLDLF